MDEIKSLDDFAKTIESMNAGKDYNFIYRGCGKSNYTLSPSLFRHRIYKKIEDFLDLESKILDRFKTRSIPYLQNPIPYSSDWGFLFLMQHFGVPTRLLDWSENPYIALFFSLTSAEFNTKTKNYKNDAAFWILNATIWNKKAIDKNSYEGEILTPNSPHLNGYKPLLSHDQLNKNPVAIYGEYNSQRIVAQRGAFTIFGSNVQPMEKIKTAEGFPADSLIKYRIDKNNIPKLLHSLLSIGFTDSVVFPDLEGLSKEIKRLYKFEEGYV